MKYNNKKYYFYAFFLSLIIASIAIVPYIIVGNGIFTLGGDFNTQQIPFGIYVNRMIKTGNFIYDWGNQLGNSFLESFSFYNLGSVFYLLTLPFKPEYYPYFIGPLLILKYGVAGLTSYAYIQTFCRDKKFAVLGSILYAFSGFQITNMMFNHFHDVVALFPLLLLTLDNLILKKKKMIFPLTLALLAITNYFFFVGQCVFLLLYFICNIISKRYSITKRELFYLVFEVIIGLLLSGILLYPSLLNIFTSARVSSEWTLRSAFLYKDLSVYVDILKSFIVAPDLMFSRTFINQFNYYSVEQWLPLCGFLLVIPFIKNNRKSFITYLIIISIIFMFIPILNSSFVGFNTQYYARWYYMPILLYCICSVKTLEDHYEIKSGIFVNLLLWILLFVLLLIYYIYIDKKIICNKEMLYFNLIVSIISFFIILFFYKMKCNNKNILYLLCSLIIVSIYIFSNNLSKHKSEVTYFDSKYTYEQEYIKNYIDFGKNIYLDVKDDYRFSSNYRNNLNYLISKPAISNFISTMDENFVEFFSTIYNEKNNMDYLVSPYFDIINQYYITTFLSNKYYIYRKIENGMMDNGKEFDLMFDNIYYENESFIIYENKYFLSIGLLYDKYINVKDFNVLDLNKRNSAYLKGVILDDNLEIDKDYLKQIDKKKLYNNSFKDFINDYNDIKDNGTTTFIKNKNGFEINVDAKNDSILLITIPYDKSWKAYVDNKEVKIEKVSNGFIGMKVSKGFTDIIFKYETKGVKTGIVLSIIGLIPYIISIFYYLMKRKNIKKEVERNSV